MAIELEGVRAFVKVAEVASFTRAATQLGVSKSRVSLLVQALETELGTRLFQRSTRLVRLTSDGEQLLSRAERFTQEAEELSSLFRAPSVLKGKLRVDLPVNLARDQVIPRLPEFFAAHPGLELQLSVTDRRVDVLREGFDCVLRVGQLDDSTLVVKRLGALQMMNAASAAYLVRQGVPKTLDDLSRHFVVHYSSKLGAEPPSFEHFDGKRYVDREMKALVTVNNVDAYYAACLAGFGIVQVPRISMASSIASGAVVEVLPEFRSQPLPVSIVHGYARVVPQRVRVFITWLSKTLGPFMSAGAVVG